MKLVVFDLDNTLYDEKQYFDAVFKNFCKKYNIPYNTSFLTQYAHSNGQDIFKDFLLNTQIGYSQQYHNELFDIYCTLSHPLSLYSDASEILQYLQNKNITFAILTNGPVLAQKNKIKNLNLEHLDIFYAREEGKQYEKPHKQAFYKVLNCYPNATQSFFVGDTLETDIIGAKNAKMFTIYINRDCTKKSINQIADLEIENLNELRKLF